MGCHLLQNTHSFQIWMVDSELRIELSHFWMMDYQECRLKIWGFLHSQKDLCRFQYLDRSNSEPIGQIFAFDRQRHEGAFLLLICIGISLSSISQSLFNLIILWRTQQNQSKVEINEDIQYCWQSWLSLVFMLTLFLLAAIHTINKQMDKTFNFFKSKAKKQNERPRNNSKSNSSKGSYSRHSDKMKATIPKSVPLSKKQRQIRQAIQFRYQKSKIRLYRFERIVPSIKRDNHSSRSSQMQEYSHLKKLKIVDLKEFHKQQNLINSNHSSQQRKKFNLRFKFKESNNSTIMRTEGNDSSDKNPYLKKLIKNPTPTKISKRADEWKFISIQLKQDLSKPKSVKNEMKISSHRSYNLQKEKGSKLKSTSSMHKYVEKAIKAREESKLARTKV